MKIALSPKHLQDLCNTAIEAAREAGQWIESYDRRHLEAVFKDSGSSQASQLVTQVDLRSEEIIRHHLQSISQKFDIAFVGEESAMSADNNTEQRFEKPFFWCVDPLDGTLPFTQGHAGYAVSIALVEQSGRPIIGIVYDPANQVLMHGIDGQACYRNMAPFSRVKSTSESLEVYADASFKSHAKYQAAVSALEQCAQLLNLDDLSFIYGNGAVKNAYHVIDSNHACYLKLPKQEDGGGSIWDFAATACIANQAGAWASDIHGKPLSLNRPGSTFMNHDGILFASNQDIARYLIDAL